MPMPADHAISGETVTIDGAASFDPDGDTLSFYWQQTEGDPITLPDNRNSSISFVAPMVAAPYQYRVQLSVSDGALSRTDSVNVLVFPFADSVPPGLVSRSPQINEAGVATSTVVTATFNEPIAVSTVTDESFSINRENITVAGSVSYNAETFTASFDPEAELEAEAEYTVTLNSGLEDVAGNRYGGAAWTFTTGSHYNLGQTDQSTIDTCMSETDKQMLTRVNNARQQARICAAVRMWRHPTLPGTAAWKQRLKDILRIWPTIITSVIREAMAQMRASEYLLQDIHGAHGVRI